MSWISLIFKEEQFPKQENLILFTPFINNSNDSYINVCIKIGLYFILYIKWEFLNISPFECDILKN